MQRILSKDEPAVSPFEVFCYPNKPIRFYSPKKMAERLNSDWIVQPKWDGHRALIYCDKDHKVTIFSRHGRKLQRAKDNYQWLNILPIKAPFLLDGELLKNNRLIVWDYAIWGGYYQFKIPYLTRYRHLKKSLKKYNKGDCSIEVIDTYPINNYKTFLLNQSNPDLEGFIFKNAKATDFWGPFQTRKVASQLKYRFE